MHHVTVILLIDPLLQEIYLELKKGEVLGWLIAAGSGAWGILKTTMPGFWSYITTRKIFALGEKRVRS